MYDATPFSEPSRFGDRVAECLADYQNRDDCDLLVLVANAHGSMNEIADLHARLYESGIVIAELDHPLAVILAEHWDATLFNAAVCAVAVQQVTTQRDPADDRLSRRLDDLASIILTVATDPHIGALAPDGQDTEQSGSFAVIPHVARRWIAEAAQRSNARFTAAYGTL